MLSGEERERARERETEEGYSELDMFGRVAF